MQLDTRIPLMAQAPKIEPYENQLARALQVRQLQGQVENQDRTMQQRNALAGVLGSAFDDSGRLTAGSLGRIAQAAPDFAPQYAQLANTQQRLERQDAVTKATLSQKRFQWLQNAVGAAKDYDSALTQLDMGVRGGFIEPQEAQAWAQEIPRDPVQFQSFISGINQQMMTAAQRAELKKGSFSAPVQTNQGFAQIDRDGNVRIATGPDGKPLMPTTLDASGQAAVTGAKKEAEENAKRQAAAKADLPKLEAGISTIERVLNSIENHPGKNRAVGAYMGQVAPSLLGADAVDFTRKLEQLQGNLFLQAYDQLRGGGQITEVEGAKAEAAMANMSRAQSVEQFNAAVKEFREVVQAARQRARNAAKGIYDDEGTQPGQSTAAAPSGVLSPAQPAAQSLQAPPAGRTVTRTGTIDGRKVVQYSDGSVEYAD